MMIWTILFQVNGFLLAKSSAIGGPCTWAATGSHSCELAEALMKLPTKVCLRSSWNTREHFLSLSLLESYHDAMSPSSYLYRDIVPRELHQFETF